MRMGPPARGQFPIFGTVGNCASTNRSVGRNFVGHGLLLFSSSYKGRWVRACIFDGAHPVLMFF